MTLEITVFQIYKQSHDHLRAGQQSIYGCILFGLYLYINRCPCFATKSHLLFIRLGDVCKMISGSYAILSSIFRNAAEFSKWQPLMSEWCFVGAFHNVRHGRMGSSKSAFGGSEMYLFSGSLVRVLRNDHHTIIGDWSWRYVMVVLRSSLLTNTDGVYRSPLSSCHEIYWSTGFWHPSRHLILAMRTLVICIA